MLSWGDELVEAARSADAGGLRLYTPQHIVLKFDYRRRVWTDEAAVWPSCCDKYLLEMRAQGMPPGKDSFQDKRTRDAYLPNYLEFRARFNRLFTNLLLGRPHWFITTLAQESTIIARDFPCVAIDISPIKMDWLLWRFAVNLEQLQSLEAPQDLGQMRFAWSQRTRQYHGHIFEEDDAADVVPCRSSHEIKQAQTPNDGSTLLHLPREVLDLIIEFVLGREGKTIWTCHKYGPICANRATARCCIAHKDSLFYPKLEQASLQQALTSSPWKQQSIKDRQSDLRGLISSNMSSMRSDELMEYLDYGNQKNMLLLPHRESITAPCTTFHKLHCLDTNVMASCKTLNQATEEAMLRIKTIGIVPHHTNHWHAGSNFGKNALTCGRCINFLQKAKSLHIRCLDYGQLQATAGILLKRSDINNLTYRLPILDFSPLKGLRVNNRLALERLYPHPDPWLHDIFVLDVIIKDWLEDDNTKIAIFQHLLARQKKGDASCWHDREFDILWQKSKAWNEPPQAPMLEVEDEDDGIYEDHKESNFLDNILDW